MYRILSIDSKEKGTGEEQMIVLDVKITDPNRQGGERELK